MTHRTILSYSLATFLFFAGLLFAASNPAFSQENDEKQEKHKHTNALAKETSPYLLMHAHNPVNWYGWGEEALKKAKDENKPIFLSIGYSSCHWCHVMERESFYDEEIAALLNENFVCIKVDREERPDVDAIYMESLHVINQISRRRGGGGWPLSMFLTPEAKPFFGGTYFPARKGDRGARLGFLDIVKMIDGLWKNNPDRIFKDSDLITKYTRESLEGSDPSAITELQKSWIQICKENLEDTFDPDYGGFNFQANNPKVPKFPQPSNLLFLLEYCRNNPDKADAKNMLVTTCERMMMGGIYDHLGGGFHRYSVDRYWAIPHFEKMLYDNGQLASVYAEAYKLTGREDFKQVVVGTLEWVSREMTMDQGGFYSALDAESEGEEGKFYRWDKKEVQSALSDAEFKLFAEVYGLDQDPNFEEKYYAPQLGKSPADIAKSQSMSWVDLDKKLAPIRKKLFDIRTKRERPLLDNKVLTSWNGMMIRGFADAGRLLENKAYVEAAEKAADFMLNNMIQEDGRLWRTNTQGESKLNGYLDDYANLIDGLLALHAATDDKKWLDAAIKLQTKQDELFWDEAKGGYFFTSADHEQLLVRGKKSVDSALPAGNSVSSGNLVYLHQKTGNTKFEEKAKKTVLSASGLLDRYPNSAPRMLISTGRLIK